MNKRITPAVIIKAAGVVERTIQDQVDNNEGWRKWFFSNNRQDDSGVMKHPLSSDALWLKKTALNMRLSKLKPLLREMEAAGVAFKRVEGSIEGSPAAYRPNIEAIASGFVRKKVHEVTGLKNPSVAFFKSSKGMNRWLNDKKVTAMTTVPSGAVAGAGVGAASTNDDHKKAKNALVGAIAGAGLGSAVLHPKVHTAFTNMFKYHPDKVTAGIAHEMGHHQQFSNAVGKKIQDIDEPTAYAINEMFDPLGSIFGKRTTAKDVALERDASQRATKIITDLKIPVDKKRVNRDLSYYLNTYKAHAGEKMGKEDFFKTSGFLSKAKDLLSKSQEIPVHELERMGYEVVKPELVNMERVHVDKVNVDKMPFFKKAQAQVLKGGKADNKSDKDFDPKSLKKGMKVESEHTSNKRMQKEIAQDHLTEDKQYYQKLEKMEKKAVVNKVINAVVSKFPKMEPIARNYTEAMAQTAHLPPPSGEIEIARRVGTWALKKTKILEKGKSLVKTTGDALKNISEVGPIQHVKGK